MKVIISENAKFDLESAINYYYLETFDDKTIISFLDDFNNKIDLIKDFPKVGKQLCFNSRKTEIRYIVFNNYFVFYKNTVKGLIILRIINTRRDYISQLISDGILEIHE